ncbi:PRC-barrel domain-containing protein [Saliphagus sp. GCM10025334]|uniref:PRC-barrel domain-containing protein n=1 Tax=Natronosalvus TaxID=3076685 RepID=UPI00209ED2CB|nr:MULTISPECIES: PRC-barrel domain-containing protein [Natronosalvus]USZ70385.1 PRC-barrel domain-containing protein [Natronosalvus halobius]
MSEILAENLSGKSVMGSDGTELGLLYNITMDINSGKLHDLVVDPDEQLPSRSVDFDRNDAGRFLIPVSRVQAVKDYIVVQR